MGEVQRKQAFWSHAVASQPAATVAGRAPPMTSPKYRPPAVATVAGEPISSSRRTTSSASSPVRGSGCRSSPSRASASADGVTGRSRTEPR